MSFSGSSLEQGARLDRKSFMNKTHSRTEYSQEDSPPRLPGTVPLSYAYGAPTLVPKTQTSPNRQPSPTRSTASTSRHRSARSTIANNAPEPEEDLTSNISFASATAAGQEPGAVRYARLKQRNQALGNSSFHSSGPGIIISPPNGENLRDTSVNVATAFHQAVSAMPSGSGQQDSHLIQSRRIAAPPSKVRKPNSTASNRSYQDDSTDRSARAKSPGVIEGISSAIARALSPNPPDHNTSRGNSTTSYLLKEPNYQPMRFEEPVKPPSSRTKASQQPSNDSYDYEAEERFVRGEASLTSNTSKSNQQKKKSQMSVSARLSMDNKAYKPSSSEEESEEDWSEDNSGRRRKKKKKKDEGRGMVLPTIGYDKRRKKKKGGAHADEEEEDNSLEEPAAPEPQRARSKPPSRAGSLPREDLPPSHPANHMPEIPETEDEELLDTSHDQFDMAPPSPPLLPRAGSKDRPPPSKAEQRGASKEKESRRSRSRSRGASKAPESKAEASDKALNHMEAQQRSSPPRGVGAALGSLVNSGIRGVVKFIAFVVFLFWTVISGIIHICVIKPFGWLTGTGSASRDMPMKNLARVVAVAVIVGITAFALNPSSDFASSISDYVWSLIPERRGSTYHAPSIPVETVDDLIARLTQVEAALADVVASSASKESRTHKQAQQAIDQVQSRLEAESQRARETEERLRIAAAQGLAGIRQELETLHTEWDRVRSAASKDELDQLRDRVGSVEGNVKEAIELAKKVEPQTGVKWDSRWNKGITIKSDKGQDITAIIGSMVDNAFSRVYKDGIAKADFALFSAGGRVIPSLTTSTYEIKPDSWGRYFFGAVTGSGYAMGRPPITALHPDIHVGNCWPFAGSQGQLGIHLARRVFISEVTIEHAPRDVAYDLSSAPRQMELWGMVEGQDNIAKVGEYQRIVRERREEIVRRAKAEGVEPPPDDDAYPPTIPRSPHYIRLAQFAYDVHAAEHLQTFKVPQEIQDIGADFGIVLLLIKNNWGEQDYTCLYRVRVHGTEKDRRPLHLSEQDSS